MPVIIAEISGNHNGALETAKQMIRTAAGVGCDIVKFQLYRPEDLGDPDNNAIYEKCMVPAHWLPDLFETAEHSRIKLFASVFAPWAVQELQTYPCWAYKIASPESTALKNYSRLLDAIKRTGKQFIVSSGRKSMAWAKSLNPDLLFYCVAGYPANVSGDDIDYLTTLPGAGFSDHSDDITVPLAMIKAGATAIEKHFKLDDDCIDTAFSLNPRQMELLCRIAHRT